jgi:hypothetical protein
VVGGGDLRHAAFAAKTLGAEERHEVAHLFLDGLEPFERVEFLERAIEIDPLLRRELLLDFAPSLGELQRPAIGPP